MPSLQVKAMPARSRMTTATGSMEPAAPVIAAPAGVEPQVKAAPRPKPRPTSPIHQMQITYELAAAANYPPEVLGPMKLHVDNLRQAERSRQPARQRLDAAKRAYEQALQEQAHLAAKVIQAQEDKKLAGVAAVKAEQHLAMVQAEARDQHALEENDTVLARDSCRQDLAQSLSELLTQAALAKPQWSPSEDADEDATVAGGEGTDNEDNAMRQPPRWAASTRTVTPASSTAEAATRKAEEEAIEARRARAVRLLDAVEQYGAGEEQDAEGYRKVCETFSRRTEPH